MSDTADLEIDTILALELDFLVIQLAGQVHGPVSRQDQFPRGFGSFLQVSDCRHGASLEVENYTIFPNILIPCRVDLDLPGGSNAPPQSTSVFCNAAAWPR